MESQSEEMDEPALTHRYQYIQGSNPQVKNWLQLMENQQPIAPAVRELWKKCVPNVFQLEKGENDVPHWPYNEHEKMLFLMLEDFISGGDDLKCMIDRLSSPPLCGRALKEGEPAYSCRECGTDPTCVLCAFCFKNSIHQHHKYKMHTSAGNGRCDCGDVEAWSSGPYCDIHKEAKQKHDNDSSVFPEDVAQRAKAVFEIVLAYAFELLTHKHSVSLPSDLKKTGEAPFQYDVEDSYCVVLYNDESHTFEQVFEALQKVLNDVYRDLVNRVDREGRAVIKVSSFQHCMEIKSEVEHCTSRQHNQALKVQVLHTDVVAHQIFALKLLNWMDTIVQTSAGFRREFANVFLNNGSSSSIAHRVLMEDANMWIAARLGWHRLIMAGLLIEYDIKKAFAKLFTKRYGCITKEYIRDDHARLVSVLSLSVQLYTLPTVAHYLIAEERALLILWNTISSEFKPKVKENNKFAFERHQMSLLGRRIDPFYRILETFYDIKYLLFVEPKSWTDDLRRGFLEGLAQMVDLMVHMQDMEPLKRQVGQHVEYEPEYETGFALHKSMAQIYPLVVDWCSTDRLVLIKAYRMVLAKLPECAPMDTQPETIVSELANHSATCIVYDPSVDAVSVYLPLTRLLAGLHLALEKHGLFYDSPELQPAKQLKPTPHLLLEPVLRLQVMIAQVWAGMWRRNGFSIMTQVTKYHSSSNRNEMQDRDICMIQICASLIESNEFLIIMLHKFNLLKWADPKFLDSPDTESVAFYSTRILEEFLGLLVVIVSERYTPGIGQVTEDDQMKKEIIQLLCPEPLSHSELHRAFPFGHKHFQEARIESVIEEVADFKRPANKVGVYELKEKHYADCNVFYYHYDAEDRSHAEEVLRKKNKEKNGMDCCPPPLLPPLCPPFAMILNLLQCDVMLHLLKLILTRYSSELQVHMALHLIGHALHEQEREPDGFLQFTDRASSWNIEGLLEELLNSGSLETLQDLLKWVLTKFRSVKAGSSSTDLVTPSSQNQAQELADKDKERRAKLAAEKRARVMAQMAAMQKNFMKENASMFQLEKEDKSDCQWEDMDTVEVSELPPVAIGPNQSPIQGQMEQYICILCQEEQTVSCTGSALVLAAYVQKSVVMARKADKDTPYQGLFLSTYLGPAAYASTCGHVMHSFCWKQYYDNVQAKESRRPYRLRQPASFDIENKEFLCPLCNCLSNAVLPLVPQIPLLYSSLKVDKGGDTCISFKSWLLDLKSSPHFRQDAEIYKDAMKLMDSLSQDASKPTPTSSLQHPAGADSKTGPGEGPSPSCVQVSVIKSIDSATQAESLTRQPGELSDRQPSNEGNEASSSCVIQSVKRQQPQSASAASSSDNVASSVNNENVSVDAKIITRVVMSEDVVNMIMRFCERIQEKYSAYDKEITELDLTPLRAWQCCAYTIHSLEILLRDEGKPLLGNLSLRQHDCLKGLVRMMALLTTAWDKPMLASTHAHMIITFLVNNSPDQSCLLDWDSFGVMVPLVFLLAKSPVPSGGGYEIYSFRLALFMEILKCLISICNEALNINSREGCSDQPSEVDKSETMEVEETESACGESSINSDDLIVMQDLLMLLCNELSVPVALLPNSRVVWEKVKEYCRPFLRCCVLFFHFLTTVPAREVLTNEGGDTFDNMCSYLGMSGNWRDIIFDDTMQALAKHWTNHPRIHHLLKQKESKVFTSPLKINRLVPLAQDYSELLCSVLEFYCHDRVESRCPTMCLVCGEMLCSQTSCCVHRLDAVQVGSCTYHSVKCGAGCGLFLQVRRCQVLVLALPNRGCFMTPPYVDDYGETDQGLRRGNRLQLSPGLYRELELIWLSHGIREYVSRSMDKGVPQIAGQWHEL